MITVLLLVAALLSFVTSLAAVLRLRGVALVVLLDGVLAVLAQFGDLDVVPNRTQDIYELPGVLALANLDLKLVANALLVVVHAVVVVPVLGFLGCVLGDGLWLLRAGIATASRRALGAPLVLATTTTATTTTTTRSRRTSSRSSRGVVIGVVSVFRFLHPQPVLVDPKRDHAQPPKLTLDVGVVSVLPVEERLEGELDEPLRRVLALLLLLLLLALLTLLLLLALLLLTQSGAFVALSAAGTGSGSSITSTSTSWCCW